MKNGHATLSLERSSQIYATRGAFSPFGPYVWRYPAQAWRALFEFVPWEALGVAVLVATVTWRVSGSDLGQSIGIGSALGLGVLQLLRTKKFLTPDAIVQQRGLFFVSRRVTPLADIRRGWVAPLEGTRHVGDVVLDTAAGEVRLAALAQPEEVLAQILRLRDAKVGLQ